MRTFLDTIIFDNTHIAPTYLYQLYQPEKVDTNFF